VIHNTEWPKWQEEMSAAPGVTEKPLRQPRPGHADLVGMQKYGFDDARNVLERASARETAARVAAGSLAKALLSHLGSEVISHVIQLGPVRAADERRPVPADLPRVDESPVRCFDPDAEAAMITEIEAVAKAGDSLGGVVEVLGYGVPPGLGSHVHWDRRVDGLIAQALMSIQAMKGVEIGDGFRTARRRGSAAHDEMMPGDPVKRLSNRAGGIEGGMTNGEPVRVRAAMKPISTVPRALRTVDVATGEAAQAIHQRSDVCAVPAAGVVAEAMVALVLADAALEKFGGDSLAETRRNLRSYLAAKA
jgi:chorismate synthase